LIVSKHRNGRVGTVSMIYQPELTRFESLAKGRY
jgi:replicative DNA helicase